MKRVDNRRSYISQLNCHEDRSQIESELNNLVTKQLLSDATLRGFSSSKVPVKLFISSSKQVDSLSSIEGVSNAREYKDKLDRQERENGLSQDGLSRDEIQMLLKEFGYVGGVPRNPSVLAIDKKEIQNKIDEKHRLIRQQSSSVCSRIVSRHELELEMSAHEIDSHPLKHLLTTDPAIRSDKDSMLLRDSLQELESRTVEKCRKRRQTNVLNGRSKKPVIVEEIVEENDLIIKSKTGTSHETSFSIDQVTQTDPSHVRTYRLSLPEIKQIPRFSSYTAGTPSTKLYIKNLHRSVTLAELASLFIKFQPESGPAVKFRLLTGRMKGQAFVEFPNVIAATEALYYSNGFILKGKPMIVQYANV